MILKTSIKILSQSPTPKKSWGLGVGKGFPVENLKQPSYHHTHHTIKIKINIIYI
jgi:hypothetical protein